VGKNGHGPVDYEIDLLNTTSSKSICVSEVIKDDFKKGVIQIAMQMESILITHKRMFSEMEEENFVGEAFSIVTDGEKWYFLECMMDDQKRPKFKLSRLVFIDYHQNDLNDMVEVVLDHIAWFLKRVLKLDEVEKNKRVKVNY